jgi:Mnd1 HTH domain/Leucine zipper with capping helix domain
LDVRLVIPTHSAPLTLATKCTYNSIADINQSLIDDGLVDKEKIGGSNYFWSFPAKRDRKMQLQHDETLQSIRSLQVKVKDTEVKLADAKRGREDDDGERVQKLARLAELSKEQAASEAELESLKENDPQALADLQKELQLVTQAAHRWTDNIFSCKAYLTKKRAMDPKEACKYLQITSAFDCEWLFRMCVGLGLWALCSFS